MSLRSNFIASPPSGTGGDKMDGASMKYTYWQDEEMWLGYLDDYPDYITQGETEEELRENLLDIRRELEP